MGSTQARLCDGKAQQSGCNAFTSSRGMWIHWKPIQQDYMFIFWDCVLFRFQHCNTQLTTADQWGMCRLQSGRFDAPDRLFCSINEAWESVTTGTADVKELIPEFFLPNPRCRGFITHLIVQLPRRHMYHVTSASAQPWHEPRLRCDVYVIMNNVQL